MTSLPDNFFNTAREEIEVSIEKLLEDEDISPEHVPVISVWDITQIYERYLAKLILTQPKKVLADQGLTAWVTTHNVDLRNEQDSGYWAYVETALRYAGLKPGMTYHGIWTVHELPSQLVHVHVWVGWAIDEHANCTKIDACDPTLVAVWPGAVFALRDISAWNDWDEVNMKMICCNLDAWFEECNGGKSFPQPPPSPAS